MASSQESSDKMQNSNKKYIPEEAVKRLFTTPASDAERTIVEK